ncbi:C25 family cysteine peptidase [Chloroflexus sp.]|uniref:C25 family cysteine peptidase n=1 Tax=Chloroflexus sp. TaxID=1904827 RepID=UPI0026137B3B|nr:C25 family cysteine peptidase [uncultured Chloroflexus sp.]
MTDEWLYFNGINASRGEYAHEPLAVDELARRILGDRPSPDQIDPDPEQRAALRDRYLSDVRGSFRVKEGVDPTDLAQAGWAIIFPATINAAPLREALSELLNWRRAQAGPRYRECVGPQGYRPGESKVAFLRRQGAATSGPVDPDRFPYYLLLVGSPEEIPFRFQYQLDVQYAVGRIYFDTLEEYAAYARSVTQAERDGSQLSKRVVFAGVQNPDDVATSRSLHGLVQPLVAELTGHPQRGDWSFELIAGAAATKDRLTQALYREPPALLFTASHGVEFDLSDARQIRHQGAILCADWPGPQAWRQRALPPQFYLSADDIASDAVLTGAFVFQFACFGAGCPREDDFPHLRGIRSAIASQAFIAGLPRRLLSLPRGGALAFVGHVERAWTFSFSDSRGGRQIETFSSALRRLLFAGAPVGYALEFFNERYAELATVLTEDIENARWGQAPDPVELATRWTEHNDARSYIIVGDPATRLCARASTGVEAEGQRLTGVPVLTTPAVTPEPGWAASEPKGTASEPTTPVVTPESGGTASESTTPVVTPESGGTASEPTTPAVTPESRETAPTMPVVSAAVPVLAGSLPPETPVIPVTLPDAAASFGLFGNKPAEAVQKLTESLQQFGERLATTLQQVIADAAHLEVETYVAVAPETIDYRQGDFSGATLRAVTRMSLDGDTQVLVPVSDEGIDERLWAIHVSMVQQAQANRAEMVRAIAAAVAGLLSALQGK